MGLIFHPNEIRIFDRAGNPLGSLTGGWSVQQPRSYRLNEIEDFAFTLAQRDDATGTVYLTAFVVETLLREDNLIYVANGMYGMRGWAGQIRSVGYTGQTAQVKVDGAFGLLNKLDTDQIAQDDGYVWTIAERLVSAAQAKQTAHGDLVVAFEHIETPGAERRNFGHYSYEGDVLAGLQQLTGATVSECYTHARIRPDGTLRIALKWGGRIKVDHSDIVIHDGPDGALLPGNSITFSSADSVNRARLRGSSTQLEQYVDYASVRSVLKNVTPEATLSLDEDGDFHRRREELNLSVGFGYSAVVEKALAAQVQELYLGFYKTFLYAHHKHLCKPFLDGYDWPGPDGTNDKRLTAHYGRTYSRLGYVHTRTVVVGSTDDDDESVIEAEITDWRHKETITPVPHAAGVATNWIDTDKKFIADASTGNVYELDSDLTTLDLWQNVTGGGETLKGIATDSTRASVVWVLVTTGSAAIVRQYDASDGSLVSQWSVAQPSANDLAVDATNGIAWLVTSTSATVLALDINSGATLSGTFSSFGSGLGSTAVRGISVSGGVAYIVDSAGKVRMLFDDDGNFAGELSTGVSADGIFVDQPGGLVWMVRSDGSIELFHAHIAVDSAGGDGIVEGAPGFETISAGQFVHVVFNTDTAAIPHSRRKLLITYAKGAYVTQVVPSGVDGGPDLIQRTWVTGETRTAWIDRSKVHWTTNEQVIRGEESRVDEWNPREDGYGYYGKAIFQTHRGHLFRLGMGWHFTDWDIPDTAFQPEAPEWTDGLAYLQDYLALQNRRRVVQALTVRNVGSLFRKIVLGGVYTVTVTRQGPPGGFAPALFRVMAFTPDERQGRMELIGEWI